MVETNSIKVVVIGNNYSNILTMVRSLGKQDINSDIVRVSKNKVKKFSLFNKMMPEKRSKYVNMFYYCNYEYGENRIIDLLNNIVDKNKKNFILPVDDYSVSLLSRNVAALKDKYILPSVDSSIGDIYTLINKNTQIALAKEFNISTIDSYRIHSTNGKFEVPNNLEFPCFVKPSRSDIYNKDLMKKCNDLDELQEHLNQISRKQDFDVIIEKFIEISEEYSLLGACVDGYTLNTVLFKMLLGGHRNRKGVTIVGKRTFVEDLQSITEQCKKMLYSIKFTGLFDIDIVKSIQGDIFFLELNLRAGASVNIATETGINLPCMWITSITNNEKLDTTVMKRPHEDIFVSEKVLMEEMLCGDISYYDARKILKIANIFFMYDKEDIEPYNYFKKYFNAAIIFRWIYKIVRYIKIPSK